MTGRETDFERPGGKTTRGVVVPVVVVGVVAVVMVAVLARPGVEGQEASRLGVQDVEEPASDASPSVGSTPSPGAGRGPTVGPRPDATATPRRPPERVPPPEPGGLAVQWRALPDPPDAGGRRGFATGWTGTELLVWGGSEDQGLGGRFLADGAALATAADAQGEQAGADDVWRVLPDAPIAGRADAAAAWTGQELVVWGGTGRDRLFDDGAAYDPATDAWRSIAASPLSPRTGAAAVWTGRELVVAGGNDNAGPRGDAAAYDPAADRWRPLPSLPRDAVDYQPTLRHTALGPVLAASRSDSGLLTVVVLGDRGWRTLPSLETPGYVAAVGPAGEGLLALIDPNVGTVDTARRLASSGATWERAASPPPWRGFPLAVQEVAGGLAVASGSGIARYDAEADRWAASDSPPTGLLADDHTAAFAGDVVVYLAASSTAAGGDTPLAAAARVEPPDG